MFAASSRSSTERYRFIRLGPLSHVKDCKLGLCGTSMSGICFSLRSSTERHGDFSESVVFHASY